MTGNEDQLCEELKSRGFDVGALSYREEDNVPLFLVNGTYLLLEQATLLAEDKITIAEAIAQSSGIVFPKATQHNQQR